MNNSVKYDDSFLTADMKLGSVSMNQNQTKSDPALLHWPEKDRWYLNPNYKITINIFLEERVNYDYHVLFQYL